MDNRLEPLEDLVGDLFVDRQKELTRFWDWATSIPNRIMNSHALIGRRRTGKTAILVKLFNRLFFDQDRVLPVFITFARYLRRKEVISYYDFAREYFTGYLKSYLAFRYRKPLFVSQEGDIKLLKHFASQVHDDYVVDLCDQYEEIRTSEDISSAHGLAQWIINLPRGVARTRNMPTAIIVDEFQVLTDVYDPKQNLHHDLTDSFQWAVDTKWAPILVSGSAVSLLVSQALTGMLQGRFGYHYLKPLPRQHAHDLVFRLGEFTSVTVTEEFAEALWQITGGYPYSITAVMTSECASRQHFPSLEALHEVMTFELTETNGKLWQHYYPEFEKYSKQLNEGGLTRRVMLWATRYPEERIDAEAIAQKLTISEQEVCTALEKLRWIDVVEKIGLKSYRGPGDPMLRRFIEYQHYTEIEKLRPAEAVKDWQQEYKRLRGQINNFIGEVAEVYVEAVMRAFDGREVDGTAYFNAAGNVTLPVFEKIERRGGIVKAGIPLEIDLTAESEQRVWLVQVKYTREPIGQEAIQHFLDQTDLVIAAKGYANVTRWYFCKQGYTAGAAQCLQDAGVLYSTLEQFNALAKLVGFFGLPSSSSAMS